MPTIYSEINLEISVTLDNDHDFEFEQWTDDSLKSTRSGYGHSEFMINFIIPNPEDERSPGMFAVENDDIYFGAFDVTKNKRTFTFIINGKFKSSITKVSKEILDHGNQAVLDDIVINGQSLGVSPEQYKGTVVFSNKKIS